MPEPSQHMESDAEALERFIVENDDLFRLEERIGRLNVFDALGIARAEIRHSNFLAWLLNPAESHGHGDTFLKAILVDVVRHARRAGFATPISAIDLDGADLRGVEVFRERWSIDLLVRCRDPYFILAIENKVDAGEHGDQLARYRKIIADRVEHIASDVRSRAMYVFLTPSGFEASEDDWIPYSYRDIHRVLSRVRAMASGSLGGDVSVFLDHYLNLIGSTMMDDPLIAELCRRIYSNHRRAIDLIVANAGSTSPVLTEIEQIIRGRPSKWHYYRTGPRIVDFTYKPLLELASRSAASLDDSWLNVNFNLWRGHSLGFQIGAGHCDDMDRRRRIVERITRDRSEFGLRLARKTSADSQWHSLASGVIAAVDEREPDIGAIRSAVKKQLDEWERLWTGLPSAIAGVQ